jgi:O-antigen/teichoic acid export membrane protein
VYFTILSVMRALLKKLTADSAVYGVSNILGRFITFLLVPLYTNMLPREEYGIVIVVYAYIAFLNSVFTFGLEPAYMRHVAGAGERDRLRVFSTAIGFIVLAGLALAGLMLLFAPAMHEMLSIRPDWSLIIPLALGMVLLDATNAIPFAALRMENRARMFAGIKLASIFVNVLLNVLFVAVLQWSIVWIFVSGVIASGVSTLLLLPIIVRRFRPFMDTALLKALLVYGLPTMPGAIAIMLIEIIDKPIMLLLTDAATVGVYGTNYKLGIFMMLVVGMFRYAWQPLYLQLAEDETAKPVFARVLTYFTLLASIIVLLLSLSMDFIVALPLTAGRTLIAPEYWSGSGIVPIILFSYLFAGMDQVLGAGLYIRKRTMIVLYTTLTAAAVNILANLILIPLIGIYGGAFATLLAYATIAGVYWYAGKRIYPIAWESGRLLKIFLSLAASALLWYVVPGGQILTDIGWRIFIAVTFFVSLAGSGFFMRSEIEEFRRRLLLFRRAGSRG